MTNYYDSNPLKPNANKTQVCCFRLHTLDGKNLFHIELLPKILQNTDHPVYLGVALDGTLAFKIKINIQVINNLLEKLGGI